MPSPDDLIERHGDPITISRVVDYTMSAEGVSDVVRRFDHTKGIVSAPSETDTQRPEGRVDTGNLTVTVPSDQDVQVERQGGRDRVALGHIDPDDDPDPDAYTVTDVSDDTHPIADVTKTTLTTEKWTGQNLFDDAEYYLIADTLTVDSGEVYTVESGTIETYRYSDVDGELTVEGVLNLIAEFPD